MRSPGRKLFDRLNLVNANAQTVEIAQRTLSAICHATGRLQVQDSEDLHLIPMLADVTVKPPKNGYGESNKLRYRPLERGPCDPAAIGRTGRRDCASASRRAGRRFRHRSLEAFSLIPNHAANRPGGIARANPTQPIN